MAWSDAARRAAAEARKRKVKVSGIRGDIHYVNRSVYAEHIRKMRSAIRSGRSIGRHGKAFNNTVRHNASNQAAIAEREARAARPAFHVSTSRPGAPRLIMRRR